ncbi:hypothetical protein ES703_44064 [subsurface metagenome]
MAKLKAPLLSLGASGAIAGTLVYFPWKGINVVREYVVPSNPKTARQVTHRGYLTTMVAAIHTAQALAANALDSDDQVALSALAQAKGKIMTWFNQAVKLGVDCLVASEGYTVWRDGHMDDTDKDDFRPTIGLTDDGVTQIANSKFYLGTSKTNLIHTEVANQIVGGGANLTAGNGFSGLTAGVKYYWQIRPDSPDPCEGADSGIYYAVAT